MPREINNKDDYLAGAQIRDVLRASRAIVDVQKSFTAYRDTRTRTPDCDDRLIAMLLVAVRAGPFPERVDGELAEEEKRRRSPSLPLIIHLG